MYEPFGPGEVETFGDAWVRYMLVPVPPMRHMPVTAAELVQMSPRAAPLGGVELRLTLTANHRGDVDDAPSSPFVRAEYTAVSREWRPLGRLQSDGILGETVFLLVDVRRARPQ